jgi:hypothetical protein
MLEQLTGLADMVGAFGVILSLLYVGKQLKQTNAMSRSRARQSLIAMGLSVVSQTIWDPSASSPVKPTTQD